MIRLTERATLGLKEILATNGTPKDRAVKLVPGESGGLAMVIGRPKEGDAVVESEQRPLLIVDASMSARLDGVVLDASDEEATEQKDKGPRFFLRGPER
jgi:hypothetical protein